MADLEETSLSRMTAPEAPGFTVVPPVLRWYVCDLLTGDILAELPLTSGSPVRRRIANVESTSLDLPVHDDACPLDWNASVVDGKSMIVLTIDDQPTQAWCITDHAVGDTVVPINISTLEECPNRTNVPDLDPLDDTVLPDKDYSALGAGLAAPLIGRFGFTIESTPSGKVFEGTQVYANSEDRSVLAALNEDIMGADGGPEWRIFVRWGDDTHRSFDKVLEIRPRVGQDRPDAIFDLDAKGGGSIESYTRTSSYAAGKGATMLIGTSEGSGASRPVTDPQISEYVDRGWPVWEERKNFTGLDSGNFDEDTELLRRTRATLVMRQDGSETWAITGRANGPRPGVDYTEGDTIHISVAPNPPKDPAGGTAAVRVLGWELDLVSLQSTPILWDSGEDDSDG
jgi:hypothetical protein